MRQIKVIFIIACCTISIQGCITAPVVMPVKPAGTVPKGQYHRVEKGQTLWRISKIYSADLEELVYLNKITDVTNVKVGQLILIPERKKLAPAARAARKISFDEDFIWPLRGTVTSGYGNTTEGMINKGIDIRPSQVSSVVAARSGKVVFYAERLKSFGRTIIVDHQDGFSTVYAGASEVLIIPGQYITRGSPIARIGPASPLGHLHFEIRKNHLPENPNFYLAQ